MRAVVDTNVLVSALIRREGAVGPVLAYLKEGAFTLLYTDQLLAELISVLARPRIRDKYLAGRADVGAILLTIAREGESVVTSRTITVCRDARDNWLLEAAVAGRADAVVTGDRDLLVLHPFEGIPIITPTSFLALLGRR
ncbi:MAG TPA: putative toxin-antitoxin system toxin component, PIN family [Thermomicrobiales bacterium]|nr:putative toxin-antitoxin system toxin component, PIN family [Thermomicrobiales bacterium]